MLGLQLRFDDVVQPARRRFQAREPFHRAVHGAHFLDSTCVCLAMRRMPARVRHDVRKRARWLLVSVLRRTRAVRIRIVRDLLRQKRRFALARSVFFSREPQRQLAHGLAAISIYLQVALFRVRPFVPSVVSTCVRW